jgi:dTMP kinase
MPGALITFEGIDGSGKSTQAALLARELLSHSVNHIHTREPGGTRLGERLRPLLLSATGIAVAPMAELLLLAAARSQHVEEVIRPALAAGKIVLSDRYIDSTVAFQGYGRGLDLAMIDDVNRIATGGLLPDLTILYDVEVTAALERLAARSVKQAGDPARDRFDDEDVQFHERVRRGYLELARRTDRIRVIDSSGTPEQTHRATLELVLKAIRLR